MHLHRRMRTTHIVSLLAFGLGLPLAAGCSGSPPDVPQAVQARLHRAQSCADLEQGLRADALRKMNDAIDRNIASLRRWNDWGVRQNFVAEPPSAGAPGGYCGGYGGFTKITVLTLDDTAKATVVGESWFEGSYLSSRRIGTRVRAVLNGGAHGPAVEYYPSDLYQAHVGVLNWSPSR